MSRTVVIGGGIAGLATATLLALDGHDVQLLEQRDELGGRAATYSEGGFRFELGPSWYLMPRVFDHFFTLTGTRTSDVLDLVRLDPAYRVFPEPDSPLGSSHSVTIPAGRSAVTQVFESLEPGSTRALDAYLRSASSTGQLAERFFLYNPFTRPGWLTAPAVLSRLGTLLTLLRTPLDRYVAKRFTHPVIRQILGYPAVFLGTSPSAAPAMYHLMSTLDLDEGVLYPRGGFTRLVREMEELARVAGVEIVTGATVTKIVTEGQDAALSKRARTRPSMRVSPRRRKRARVRGVEWHNADGDICWASADTVVSAADLFHTETTLLPEHLQTYPTTWWQRRVSGPGAIIVTLGVRGKLPELPHHSLFFTRDWDANFAAIFGERPEVLDPTSIYVCKPSATDPDVAPDDHENLFVLVPIPADPTIGRDGDETLSRVTDAVIDQISVWADIPDLRDRIVVQRTIGPADFERDFNSWRGGMLGPAHILRQSAMFRAQNESRRVDGLFYAGATTAPGVGVPMCLISAEIVLKRIRGDHSPGPLPNRSLRARSDANRLRSRERKA